MQRGALMVKPRLLERYRNEIVPEMMKHFGYKNKMAVPRLTKVVINIGLGEASQDIKLLEAAQGQLAMITGQKPVITRAKKAIANFKIDSYFAFIKLLDVTGMSDTKLIKLSSKSDIDRVLHLGQLIVVSSKGSNYRKFENMVRDLNNGKAGLNTGDRNAIDKILFGGMIDISNRLNKIRAAYAKAYAALEKIKSLNIKPAIALAEKSFNAKKEKLEHKLMVSGLGISELKYLSDASGRKGLNPIDIYAFFNPNLSQNDLNNLKKHRNFYLSFWE